MKNAPLKFSLLLATTLILQANEIEELKVQMDVLTKKIDAYSLERKDQVALELKNKGSVLSVGGRIQLQAVSSSPEGAFYAAKIPLDKNSLGENGQLTTSAKESRLWFKTRTPSNYGPIRTLVEVDFLGVSGTETNTNSHGLRLRHAYLEATGLTFGQTNSAFNSHSTLEAIAYPMNNALVRQPLIRYSTNAKTYAYDVSFEQPETTLLDPNGKIITPQDDSLPDVVLRVRAFSTWGEASVALLSRYLQQDRATLSDASVVNGSSGVFAWGVNASAKKRPTTLTTFGLTFNTETEWDDIPRTTLTRRLR